MQPNKSRKICA